MAVCKNCGVESSEDAKFCYSCGQALGCDDCENTVETAEVEVVEEVVGEAETSAGEVSAEAPADAVEVVEADTEIEAETVEVSTDDADATEALVEETAEERAARIQAAVKAHDERVAAAAAAVAEAAAAVAQDEKPEQPAQKVQTAAETVGAAIGTAAGVAAGAAASAVGAAREAAANAAHEARETRSQNAQNAQNAGTSSTQSAQYTQAAHSEQATRTTTHAADTTIPPTRTDGYISRAWRDVRQSEGWVGKSLLLAIIMLVPILNFVAVGYLLRWGRTAAYRDGDNLPPIAITGDYFKLGFFSVVICFCWSVVLSLAASIPLIGVLAAIAAIFAVPIIVLCTFRTNLLNSLSAAFELGKVWRAFRSDVGGTMAIAWLPSLICLGVCVAIGLIMSLVLGIGAVAGAALQGAGASNALFATFGMGVGCLIVLVCAFAISIVGVAVEMVIERAFGYWIRDHEQEWLDEARAAANGCYQ